MNASFESRFGGLLRGVAALLVAAVGLWAATPATNSPATDAEGTNAPPAKNSIPTVSTASGTTTSVTSVTPATNGPAQLDYASFRVISERNIFNQNRSPRRPGRNQGGPRPRVDSFTLVGTMSYTKGDMAFFDGTGAEYRKALKAAGSIAGYKITAITNTTVTLQAAGKTIEMPVGAQMRREEGGEWQLASGGHRAETGGTNATTTAAGDHAVEPSSDNDTSGAGNDVLQRLLKKREQEMNDEKQ